MESRREVIDSPVRYGTITRVLHWLMAIAFAWVYCSAVAHYLLSESALDSFLWPWHKPVGLLLIVMLLVRVGWAWFNRKHRPASFSKASHWGHSLLYAFMFAVPFLGLLRQYGSGRAFSAFGLPVMSGFEGEKIQWMTDLGSNFHSLLGWTLLVFITGHIGAVMVHRLLGHSDILQRMLGGSKR